MKHIGVAAGMFIFVLMIVWPWLLGLASAVWWFFGMDPFFVWDSERVGFAILWPFGALAIVISVLGMLNA